MSELLNLGQLARRLRVSQAWLRGEADAGRLPCLKADKRYLFNASAVQEALATKAARMPKGGAA